MVDSNISELVSLLKNEEKAYKMSVIIYIENENGQVKNHLLKLHTMAESY